MTPEELETIRAVVAQILPSDGGPGAIEADVMGYVHWLMAQSFFEPRRARVRRSIALLDRLALMKYNRRFAGCSNTEQNAAFSEMASSASPLARAAAEMFVQISLTGFLCDPKYGGNRDGIGWRYIGAQERHATDSAR